MSVKLKVLINQSDIEIASGETICTANWETSSVIVLSDGVARNIHEWVTYIQQYAGIGSVGTTNLYFYLYDNEMVQIRAVGIFDTMTFSNSAFAEAFGFSTVKTYYVDGTNDIYGDSWGYFRLVIQGSVSSNSAGVDTSSRMIQPERITGKSKNDTKEMMKYVINSFDKRFDMKRWKITSHWLSTDNEQWVKDFLHQAGNGKSSDSLVFYGDDHWIKDTETWLLLTDAYDGIEVDVGYKRLVVFSVGLREVV